MSRSMNWNRRLSSCTARYPPTPGTLARSSGARRLHGLGGHENHTPTGAFKVRGGLVYTHRLLRSTPGVAGIVSGTTPGQSTIDPESRLRPSRADTPPVIIPLGGPGPEFGDARAFRRPWSEFGKRRLRRGKAPTEAGRACRRASAALRSLIPPRPGRRVAPAMRSGYCGPKLATPDAWLQLSVGMGSGICGLIAARDLLGLNTEIVGVGAVNAPATARSFAAGRAVATESARTFADGVATREPNEEAVEIICRGAARMVEVSEDEIAEAMRIYFDDTHQRRLPRVRARRRWRRCCRSGRAGNRSNGRYLQETRQYQRHCAPAAGSGRQPPAAG